MNINNSPILVLVGPTAIGKTSLSIEIAKLFNCEIISMDSMQIYKEMDIGTAKVTEKEQDGIPHYLLDIINPDQHYDASNYCRDALIAIDKILAKGKLPLITGGTGLYLQSLCHGFIEGPKIDENVRLKLQNDLDEQGPAEMHLRLQSVDEKSANRIHPNDSYRVLRALELYQSTGSPWSKLIDEQAKENRFPNMLKVGLTTPREKLYKRINYRTEVMLDQGLEAEVHGLLKKGYDKSLNSMGSIGYKHMINYIDGTWDYDEMKILLARDTRRYAKRQYTWFNKIEDLKWYNVDERENVIAGIESWHNNLKY
ncbi:MAG: tRNA (adenosine(37)-N6)-dimethylallyltransferase MiaA [Desulfotalea sp.]